MASTARALEAEVQQTIVDLATTLHWRVYHTFDSRKSARGFPDLVLVRERIVYAELKREGEKPRPDQVEWLDELARAGAEVYLWRLSDFDEIKQVLQGRWNYGRCFLSLTPASRRWTPDSLWITEYGRSDT